tara:strand:- start:2132 stop:2599 length:468 start_codon:yes stop_codon:yes gene_type:complete
MRKIFKTIIIIFFISACGFKIVKQSELKGYFISEVNAEGDNRINYIIKNNLLSSEKNQNKKSISLNLKSSKIKNIKEKNIKNEITKYQIIINIIVRINQENTIRENTIEISKTGEYSVREQYSQTVISEKKLVEVLANDLSEKIIQLLSERLNDL